MKFFKTVADRILPVLFWIAVMLTFDTPSVAVLTVIAALIHEGGHITAAFIIGCGDISLPQAALTGLRIRPSRLLSYKEEAVIALSGPLVNLLAFLALLTFYRASAYLFTFGVINLLTAISNLLPIRGYDGYRVVNGILLAHTDVESAGRITGAISSLLCGALVFISLFLMLKIGEGYWIFAIFFSIMLRDITKTQKSIKRENTRDFESF